SGHRETPQHVADRAFRAILARLQERGRLPSLALAKRMNMSPATLRRRLRAAGTCFRELRDACRRRVGLELLEHSELTVEELADQLDFCDSDAFRAAFHKWVGMSPTEFRRRLLAPI